MRSGLEACGAQEEPSSLNLVNSSLTKTYSASEKREQGNNALVLRFQFHWLNQVKVLIPLDYLSVAVSFIFCARQNQETQGKAEQAISKSTMCLSSVIDEIS